MPEVSEGERASRDSAIDTIAGEAIQRIMYAIPQDPADELPRPSLAQRSDAEEIRGLLVSELGRMLGAMTVARLGLKKKGER